MSEEGSLVSPTNVRRGMDHRYHDAPVAPLRLSSLLAVRFLARPIHLSTPLTSLLPHSPSPLSYFSLQKLFWFDCLQRAAIPLMATGVRLGESESEGEEERRRERELVRVCERERVKGPGVIDRRKPLSHTHIFSVFR